MALVDEVFFAVAALSPGGTETHVPAAIRDARTASPTRLDVTPVTGVLTQVSRITLERHRKKVLVLIHFSLIYDVLIIHENEKIVEYRIS